MQLIQGAVSFALARFGQDVLESPGLHGAHRMFESAEHVFGAGVVHQSGEIFRRQVVEHPESVPEVRGDSAREAKLRCRALELLNPSQSHRVADDEVRVPARVAGRRFSRNPGILSGRGGGHGSSVAWECELKAFLPSSWPAGVAAITPIVSMMLTNVSDMLTILLMNAKSLRELQQKGGKAIGSEPVVVTSRKGPVGVLIPVTSESLPRIQQEVQRMLALESLSETWKLAREIGLERMTDEEIQAEVRAVRKSAHAQPKRRH